MTPRLLLRTAALNALASAAAISTDPDFALLAGATVFLGQTWPSQSPAPGQPPLPNQLLIYCWDDESVSVSNNTTAPKFETTMTLVIEARFEVNAPAATGTLSAPPVQSAIDATIDGLLDALTFAVKKALCQGIGIAARALNDGAPVIEAIKSVKTTSKYGLEGQRISANGAVALELQYGEYFEPVLTTPLTELMITTSATGAVAATPGNAGNGTVASLAVGLGLQIGIYWILFTAPDVCQVTAPDGTQAGTGTVGTPFSGAGLDFTIVAGTTAYAAGDGFSVTVQVASQTQLNLSA